MQAQEEYNTQSVIDLVKRLVSLHIQGARLTLAEKLSMLLSALAVCSIAVLVFMAIMIFFGIFVADLLSAVMASYWAYLIVVGVYIAILAIVIVMRNRLVIDPITRYVSRLLIDPPTTDKI